MWIGFLLLLLPFMVPVTRAAENDIVVPANKHLFIGGVKFDALTITPGSGERILVNGVRLIDREEPQAPAIEGTREVQYSSEDVARYANVPAVKQLVESGTSVHDAVGICMQFELAFLDSLRETIAKGTFRLAEAQRNRPIGSVWEIRERDQCGRRAGLRRIPFRARREISSKHRPLSVADRVGGGTRKPLVDGHPPVLCR